MAAYGNQDAARAGLAFGVDFNAETKVAASGVTIAFGSAVFVDAGEEDIAYAPDSTDVSLLFLGIAMASQRSYVDSTGEYPPFTDVSVMTEGEIWVPVASGLSSIANAKAYVINVTGNAQYKKFSTSSSNAYDTGCYFRSNVVDGLARLEVRGLK